MDEAARWRLDQAVALRPRLLAVARRYADSLDDAEDAVATAIERVVDAPLDDPVKVRAWLFTTTKNTCSELRRGARVTARAAVRLTTGIDVEDPAERVCQTAEVHWFAARIRGLPKHLRRTAEVLGGGGTYHEVAAELGVTERVARRYVEDTKARLRRIVASTRAGVIGLRRRVEAAVPRRAGAAPSPVWDALAGLLVVIAVAAAALVAPHLALPSATRGAALPLAPTIDGVEIAHNSRSAWLRWALDRRLRQLDAASLAPKIRLTRNIGDTEADDTVDVVTRALPPRLREPVDNGVKDTKNEVRDGYHDGRESPPLHEWVIWCATHFEISLPPGSGNTGCPDEP